MNIHHAALIDSAGDMENYWNITEGVKRITFMMMQHVPRIIRGCGGSYELMFKYGNI
jgi:hypothetical protein